MCTSGPQSLSCFRAQRDHDLALDDDDDDDDENFSVFMVLNWVIADHCKLASIN